MHSKSTFKTATDGATVAFNFNDGQNQQVTLGGNRTFTFANGVNGELYRVKITQDATGSRLVTWPSTVKWAGGSAPTLTTTAARTDVITFIFDGTNYLDMSIVKNFDLA